VCLCVWVGVGVGGCLVMLPLGIFMSLTNLLHRGINIRVYINATYFN